MSCDVAAAPDTIFHGSWWRVILVLLSNSFGKMLAADNRTQEDHVEASVGVPARRSIEYDVTFAERATSAIDVTPTYR